VKELENAPAQKVRRAVPERALDRRALKPDEAFSIDYRNEVGSILDQRTEPFLTPVLFRFSVLERVDVGGGSNPLPNVTLRIEEGHGARMNVAVLAPSG
jgi:hypothetical protein